MRRVWDWREHYGHTIVEQFKRLGASCDYSEERFTLDEGYHRAVVSVFVALYEQGLIYRDRYIVNWDPGTRSAISDLEVEERSESDTLYSIRYDLEGGGTVTIATVRPETMLGDTAVAVHPEDERYRELVGRSAILPLVGRHLPIIADEYVKMEFGTGQLKVTPAHDPNDFEIGRRHELDQVSVIGEDGRMSAEAGERFAGLTVMEARAAVVAALREEGRIVARGGVRARSPLLPSLRRADRAADLAAVVHAHGRARRARDRRRARRTRADRPRQPPPRLPRLDGGHPPLVHLPPAVVGAPAAGVLLRHVRAPSRRRERAGALRSVRRGAAPGGGRARHVVLLGAVAVRHARMARSDAAAARLLPDGGALHRARHPLPVGGADDHDGSALHRGGAVRGRLHPLGDPGARRAAHVEVARHRHRPAGGDRPPRRRRGALRPAGDVLLPGRALLRREGAPGAGARQQAVQRHALRAAADRRVARG